MDKINFLAQDSFPVSTDTLNRLQEATSMVAALALLGGSNYILSGCQEKDGKIDPGMIVFNGEILPFLGGAPLEFIEVQETKKTLEAFDEPYPEAYIDRVVVFADLGKYKWEDMKRIVTNQELDKKIAALRGESPGFIMMWSGRIDRIPENYMLANGDTVRTDSYPELAKAYGQEHLESFTLPNLSGRFIVGYDATDKDYKEIGIAGGANEKSIKEEQMPDHYHIYSDDTNAMGSFTLNGQSFPAKVEGINNQESSAKSGGSGTLYRTTSAGEGKPFDVRPAFYTLAYLVKVKY